jgi:IS30 family transposase
MSVPSGPFWYIRRSAFIPRMKRKCTVGGVSSGAERDRRRRKAAAMRAEGMAVRAIASVLGVSHPTVLRDIRAHDRAEAEQVLAVLAGEPQRPTARPPELKVEQQLEAHRSKYYRWHYATELRQRGASLRSIARQVGASPATVLRDLRRDVDWASNQRDREDMRETRERLRERQARRP